MQLPSVQGPLPRARQRTIGRLPRRLVVGFSSLVEELDKVAFFYALSRLELLLDAVVRPSE